MVESNELAIASLFLMADRSSGVPDSRLESDTSQQNWQEKRLGPIARGKYHINEHCIPYGYSGDDARVKCKTYPCLLSFKLSQMDWCSLAVLI